ncbi:MULTISPECIES: peptidylprolyl isomerase [unclassified Arsukibacterium]|uniref:peptidylprolyl isomerase n=1 Tax=unclassified Arsukibacterium TaxID=2635278 RepID=UPI000C4EAC38|nr:MULTISPECIES: peptidylprolyl isomerase [unclassified Arsukibacterium]MAA95839.1 peptidylprolyl isomerase [Rheinheimera sp.]MBM33569.1 peptidylprolyl isomerase [Rheinheimera sp.]HAW92851.1 peptidylprolyl isomerase [Candidatus Azambacteria bacterium]|tara:strand:+ start:1101 stop:1682 length:582 start_codon:yes stop_codon:yes gene_type:complete
MRAWLTLLMLFFTLPVWAGKFMQPDNLYPKVQLETSVGNIVLELDRSRAPITVNNFLSYVKANAYNNTVFHRLIADFVVQGGGYNRQFAEIEQGKTIFNESGNGLKNQYGTIAMARLTDPHSASSQFYINLADNDSLDPGSRWGYAVFGRVISGFDVLDKLNALQTETSEKLGWPDVPVEPLLLNTVRLLPIE